MSILVRPFEAKDETRWRQLFNGYVGFYKAEVPVEVVELTWMRLLRQDDNMVGLAAIAETGEMAGFAALIFHRSTWSPTFYCYLEDLYVDPAVRGQGIGRALIEATYAEADRRGATRTYWATQHGNAAARSLYDRVAHLSEFVQYRR